MLVAGHAGSLSIVFLCFWWICKSKCDAARAFTSLFCTGVFMGVSSNTRYQIINGLERLVEHSPITRKFPIASNTFTVAIRFGNNVFGGMQFVDWARLAGVQ
jgi:hypothetical protein